MLVGLFTVITGQLVFSWWRKDLNRISWWPVVICPYCWGSKSKKGVYKWLTSDKQSFIKSMTLIVLSFFYVFDTGIRPLYSIFINFNFIYIYLNYHFTWNLLLFWLFPVVLKTHHPSLIIKFILPIASRVTLQDARSENIVEVKGGDSTKRSTESIIGKIQRKRSRIRRQIGILNRKELKTEIKKSKR